ncbi:MAG: hypothetical protein J6I49_00630 [Bacteroidales bacterium]|nr:hypothetical protein [Bacteroidales bacterium]
MKYKFIYTLLAAGAVAAACGGGKRDADIAEAAYNYCMATSVYDIDAAEAYCTEESARKTLQTARYLMQFVDSAYIASDSPVEITIKKTRQTSDTTAYAVYHKTTPIKDFTDTVQLRKRDGRWLAHTL